MILWGTDFHFDFLKTHSFSTITQFGKYLLKENPDANGIIITGDISNGTFITNHLKEFAVGFTKPIYFVLGNHCFYNSSFADVDAKVPADIELYKKNGINNLYWLNDGYYEYNNHTIVGVGGWYDAYYGNQNSPVMLSDFSLIKELRPGLNNSRILLSIIRERAKKEANCLASYLKDACKTSNKVIIVCTHIPPYPESSWHEGAISNRDFLPWFSSASTGAVLDQYSENYKNKTFIVLTGHSHSPGIFKKRNNLTVYTGKAVYGFPDLAGVINTKENKLTCLNHLNNKVEISYLLDKEIVGVK